MISRGLYRMICRAKISGRQKRQIIKNIKKLDTDRYQLDIVMSRISSGFCWRTAGADGIKSAVYWTALTRYIL